MLDMKLTPELEGIVKAAHAKTVKKKSLTRTLQDRGAPFVFLPAETQHAIVRLVLETSTLPRAPAVAALRRELEEKNTVIAELRKEPDALRGKVNTLDHQLSDRNKELREMKACAEALQEEVSAHQKREQADKERAERALTLSRRQARSAMPEDTQPVDLGQRYESILSAVSAYIKTLPPKDKRPLVLELVSSHVTTLRSRLTRIDTVMKGSRSGRR